MLYNLVLLLAVTLPGWTSSQSSSSSYSVSVPGYAPITYSSTSGNAQAVATASSPTSSYYYNQQHPYSTVPYQDGQRATRATSSSQPSLIQPVLHRSRRHLARNDANQQIYQRQVPFGIQRAPAAYYTPHAPSYSAPAGISQSIAPVYVGRDGRQLAFSPSRQHYVYPSYVRGGYARSHAQASNAYSAPYVVYAPPGGIAQAAASFAPPPPFAQSSHNAGGFAGQNFVAAAPPAPQTAFSHPSEELGSISSALSQAATAFAPPGPAGSFAESQSNAEASASSSSATEGSNNFPGANSESGSAAPPPYSPPTDGGSFAGAQAQAGENAPPGSPPSSTEAGGSFAGAQAQAGENAPPPAPPSPTEEGGNFAGAQAQAGENAPPPSSPSPAYGPPAGEAGNFAGAQAQAGENAPPPPPPPPPPTTYGAPTEVGGNFAGAQAQAGQNAPPPPPPANAYGLPTTNSEGGDSSVLTVRVPHSEYGLPEANSIGEFKVDPIQVSADDSEKSFVFVPAFPESKSPLPGGAALSPPAPGEFSPPDGALLSPPVPVVNSQLIPSPRNQVRRARKH